MRDVVAWYRLSQVQGMLGHEAEQKKAFADSSAAQPEIEPARSRKANPLARRSHPPGTRPERAKIEASRATHVGAGDPGRAAPGGVGKSNKNPASLFARPDSARRYWYELRTSRALLARPDEGVRAYVGGVDDCGVRGGTIPVPSFTVTNWFAVTFGRVCHSPFGQRILDFGAFGLAQPELQPEIIAGEEARLALHFLGLVESPVFTTTRAPMALRFDFVPTSFTLSHELFPVTSLRSSDGGSFRLITRMSRSPSLSKSPKAHPRLLCDSWIAAPAWSVSSSNGPLPDSGTASSGLSQGTRDAALNLRKSVSRNHEQVRQAVVVEIHHAGAPAHEAILHRQPGSPAGFFEIGLAHVVIEVRGIAFEIGFEDIETAVEIVVAHGRAHPGLLLAIFTIGDAANGAFFAKRAVVIVQEQQAWSGIAGHVYVRPTVIVEVSGDGGRARSCS